jgi:hypothetical protein
MIQRIGDTIDQKVNPKQPGYRVLTEEQLKKLPFHNLKRLINKVRACRSYIANYYGPRCCNHCHEYVGPSWEDDVDPYLQVHDQYLELLRKVSKELPHISDGRKLKRR